MARQASEPDSKAKALSQGVYRVTYWGRYGKVLHTERSSYVPMANGVAMPTAKPGPLKKAGHAQAQEEPQPCLMV